MSRRKVTSFGSSRWRGYELSMLISAFTVAGLSLNTITRVAMMSASSTSCVTSSAVKPFCCQSRTSSPCIEMRVSEFELSERLIEDQKFRIIDKGAGERDALRHAAGQLMRVRFREGFQAHKIEALIDARSSGFQKTLGFEAKRDIVPNAPPGVERRILEHHHARRVRPFDGCIPGSDLALQRFIEPCDEPQKRGFPAAARAKQGDELARIDMECNVLQNRQRLAFKPKRMGDIAYMQRPACSGFMLIGKRGYHFTSPF